MERLTRILLLCCLSVLTVAAGSKPVDYIVNTKGSRMTIALNGPVQWSESREGTTVRITVVGPSRNFIVKRIQYAFRDGVVKSFVMTPSHPDTERITIGLRREQAYDLDYDAASKRLTILFFNGAITHPAEASSIAALSPKRFGTETPKQVSAGKNAKGTKNGKDAKHGKETRKEERRVAATAPAAAKSSRAPIDIATLAVDQIGERSEQPKEAASAVNLSAILLLTASLIIIIAGGVALAYVIITRRRDANERTAVAAAWTEHTAAAAPLPEPVPAPAPRAAFRSEAPAEEEFEQAIEYAEQYLRTQGEIELQQRLERLNASSANRRLENAAARPAVRSAAPNTAAAAQKLGVSIGELELASRLQRFQQHQHETEQV